MIDKNYFVQLIISKLEQKKEYLVNQWENPKGTKTRYLVIDNLLRDEDCLKIYKSLNQSKIVWNKRKSFREKKNTTANKIIPKLLLFKLKNNFTLSKISDPPVNIYFVSGIKIPRLKASKIKTPIDEKVKINSFFFSDLLRIFRNLRYV